MRFAVATTMLACQTLPGSSAKILDNKKKDDAFFVGNKQKKMLNQKTHRHLMHNEFQKKKTRVGHKKDNVSPLLVNKQQHQRKAKKVGECDPYALDMGVLACGSGNYCMKSPNSSTGGICSNSKVMMMTMSDNNRRRRIQYDGYEGSYDDCEYQDGFDYETGYGTVVCNSVSPYCYYRNDSFECCFAYESTKTYGPDGYYANSVTYSFRTPYSQNVTFSSVTNSDDADDNCSIVLNGEPCTSCTLSSKEYGETCYEFDCSNTPPGMVGSNCDGNLYELIPISEQCYDSSGYGCDMCGELALDFPDETLGEEEVPCSNIFLYMYSNVGPDTPYCSYSQTNFAPVCCQGASKCSICGDGPLLYADKTVNIPDFGYFTCEAIFNLGGFGLIDEGDCSAVTNDAAPICCQAESEPEPSAAPADEETDPPVDSPTPDPPTPVPEAETPTEPPVDPPTNDGGDSGSSYHDASLACFIGLSLAVVSYMAS